MKAAGYLVLALMGAALLVGDFGLIVGMRAGGFRWPLAALFAVAGLPIPLLVGYLAPRWRWPCAACFVAVGVLALVVATMTAPIPFWPESVWDLRGDTKLVVGGYLTVGVVLVVAGGWARRASRRQPWWRLAPVAIIATASCAAIAAMGQLREVGLLPFAHGGRMAAYERLWRNLDRYYAHWDIVPVDAGSLRARYRARVEAADRECGQWNPCRPYRAAIRDMLAELSEGHTHVLPRHDLFIPEVSVEQIEHEAVITRVASGSAAERAGAVPGMVIRAVDGRAVDDALERVPRYAVAYTAAHERSYKRYKLMLGGSRFSRATIVVETAHGVRRTLALPRTLEPEPGPATVRGRRVGEGVAVIAVTGLTDGSVVSRFDEILDGMSDSNGLVLDLRGNGGGWSMYGRAIAARLIGERIVYGEECYRGGHPLANYKRGCFEHRLSPRSPVFSGRVAVLIDAGSASSAEVMALALCDGGGARCFGRTSAGDSGNPQPHFLPGVVLQYSNGDLRRLDGRSVNGTGIEPDVPVEWTLSDVRDGRDPDVEAAVRWLTVGEPPLPN